MNQEIEHISNVVDFYGLLTNIGKNIPKSGKYSHKIIYNKNNRLQMQLKLHQKDQFKKKLLEKDDESR